MYGYIYMTINILNGKRYIGQHKSDKFVTYYKGSGQLLTRAINKYGIDNFAIELLDTANSKDELDNKEIYWIEYYNAVDNSMFYNIMRGGNIYNPNPPIFYGEDNYFHKYPRIGKLNPLYGRRGKDSPHYGNKYNLGRKQSKEEREMRRLAHNPDNVPPRGDGKIWINNGEINKFVYPEQFYEIYSNNGFVRGKKKNINRRTYYMNNGIVNIRVNKDKIDLYLHNGWKRGRLLSKITDEN